MKIAGTTALLALVTATALATIGGAFIDLSAARRSPAGLLTLVVLITWPAIVPASIAAGYVAWFCVRPRRPEWSLTRWLAAGAALGTATGTVSMLLSLVLLRGWRVGLSGNDGVGATTMAGAIGGAATGVVVGAYCYRLARARAISPRPSASPHTRP